MFFWVGEWSDFSLNRSECGLFFGLQTLFGVKGKPVSRGTGVIFFLVYGLWFVLMYMYVCMYGIFF